MVLRLGEGVEFTVNAELNPLAQELIVELGRKNRDKGRGTYKQRDSKDISTLPPKPKKPIKVDSMTEGFTSGYCGQCGRYSKELQGGRCPNCV